MSVRGVSSRRPESRRPSSDKGKERVSHALLGRSASILPAPSLTSHESQKFFEALSGLKRNGAVITSRAFQDVTSDLSMLSRTGPTLGNSLLNHILGWTTAANVAAFYNVGQCVGRVAEASRRKDSLGTLGHIFEGNMSLFVGLGGLSFIPGRILSFVAQYLNIPATAISLSSLGRASYWTVSAGVVLFGLFYLAFAVWSGIHLYQLGRYLVDKIKFEGSDLITQARFLSSKVHARPLDVTQGLNQDKRDELTQLALDDLSSKCEMLHDYLKNEAKELLKRGEHLDGTALTPEEKDDLAALIDRKKPSSDEIKEKLQALFQEVRPTRRYRSKALGSLGYDPDRIGKLGFSALETYGLKLDHERRALKKHAKMERLLGSASVINIKKAFNTGLLERLKSNDSVVKAAAEVEFKALRTVERNALIIEGIYYTACFIAAALGIAVTVLSFTSPAGGALFIAVTIAMVFFMLGVDLRGVVQAFMSKDQPGKYDKAYALFIGGIMTAAFLASVGVTFGLSLSLLPLLIGGLGVVLPGIVLAGGTYIMADQRQKNWDQSHLSLETLQSELHASLTADEINGLIKRTVARQGLRAQYLKKTELVAKKGRLYLSKATKTPDADLKRASRKTSKLFWKTAREMPVHAPERERALERAQLMQKYDDLLSKGMTTEARRHLRAMCRKSGQIAKVLREQLYLIKEMKQDVGQLQKAVARELTHQQELAQENNKERERFVARMQEVSA